jgi:Ser/Thr protein kinase RdoA (MazF antagonist)
LQDYKHPRLNDQTFSSWDLVHLSDLKPYILAKYLGSKERETLIMNVYDQYISTVPQLLQKYEKQVIHNDINEGNIIVKKNLNNLADNKWSIAGIIDFGDMCYSFRVFEIATAMSQIITLNFSRGSPRALESVGKLLKGYQSVYPLSGE